MLGIIFGMFIVLWVIWGEFKLWDKYINYKVDYCMVIVWGVFIVRVLFSV